MIKKQQKPVLSILIAIAILFTIIEGAIFIMQILQRNQNNEMEMTYRELSVVLDLLNTEESTQADLQNIYDEFAINAEKLLNQRITVYLLDDYNSVIIGNYDNFWRTDNKALYVPGKPFFDDFQFMDIIRRFPETDMRLVSAEHTKDGFIAKLADYTFIYEDKVYYDFPFTISDGTKYELLLEKNLTFSGHAVQEMVMLLMIYCAVLLILWIISMCQAISRNDDFRRLQKIAYYDELTGISNQKWFELELVNKVKTGKTKKYAIIAIDIVKFKVINDFYGEEVGKTILMGVAKQLEENSDKDELYARQQGDTFLLLWKYDTIENLDERIRRLDAKMCWAYAEQSVHFRYGVFPIPDKKEEVSRMINFANMAIDNTDASKDCSIGYLDSREREKMRWEKVLEGEMEAALMNNEFEIYLQPKFLTDGSKVGGAEALVRWNSPTRGKISPDDFIPLFERNGFIMKLDDYMLEEVCKQQRKWLSEGNEPVPISVNVSRAHMTEASLVEDIVAIVDRYSLPHEYIELELTESAFFDNKQVLIDTIRNMQKHDFKVSMDDFGAGYSSLNSLKDLPLDIIKLDAGFFKDASDSERGETIVRDTIQMARNLNMKIVAEGIEKEEQVKFLDKVGCDLIQGYYFAKPMTIKEFEILVYPVKEG